MAIIVALFFGMEYLNSMREKNEANPLGVILVIVLFCYGITKYEETLPNRSANQHCAKVNCGN